MKSLFLYSTSVRQIRHIFNKCFLKSRRNYIAFLIVLLISTQLFSQSKASFSWSSFEKVNKYSQAVCFFKTEQNYGVIVKYSPNFHNKLSNFDVKIYNKYLKLEKIKTVVIPKLKEKILEIWNYKNRIYFVTQTDLPNQRISLRVRIARIDSLEVPLITKDIVVLNVTHFNKNLAFHLIKKDSSVVIWHCNPLEINGSNQSISYFNYTNDLKPIDKAIIDLNVKVELCKVLKIEDLESGKFLIYTKEYLTRQIEKRGFAPNYKFVFYLANSSVDTLKSFTFNDNKVYLQNGRLKIKEGILEATGLYTDKTEGPQQGIWYFKYNFNKESLFFDTIQYFDKKVKALPNNGFQSSVFRKSKIESFYLDYFIKLNSIDRIIIAEQFLVLPASVGSTYTYNRFYGDILLLYLNGKGEIYNSQRLIKAQQTFNNYGEFSSYYLERNDSVLNFIFNDHFKNKEKYQNKHLVWHRQNSLMITSVGENSITKNLIADYKQIDGIIQARDMLKITTNQYLVYAYKKKKGKLGIMKLEN